MIQLKELKTECTITIKTRKSVAGPFEATVHVFEHSYDEGPNFWWGVAVVMCSVEECINAMTSDDPPHLEYHIALPDGRCGAATFFGMNGQYEPMDGDEYVKIRFHGGTTLDLPRESRPDRITITDSLGDNA